MYGRAFRNRDRGERAVLSVHEFGTYVAGEYHLIYRPERTEPGQWELRIDLFVRGHEHIDLRGRHANVPKYRVALQAGWLQPDRRGDRGYGVHDDRWSEQQCFVQRLLDRYPQ